MEHTQKKVFLITGVSSGFGKAFARAALTAGHTVIGTVRTAGARQDFESGFDGRAHGIVIDLVDLASIEGVVREAMERVGPVDVLVNNAGYGQEGTLEESPMEELVRQFTVNVFGAVAMIKAVLPTMRTRRSGHIVNVTSLAGHVGAPGISYYNGSKFALEGISEALEQEVASFGIHVTALAPGAFRTEWAGRSLVRTPQGIADYDQVFAPVRRARQDKDGNQAGDPARAAQVLLELVEHNDPPTHLLLGADAVNAVRRRAVWLESEIETWEDVSRSTDFHAR